MVPPYSHNAVAGRPQDRVDIECIIYRQRDALDVAYIRFWLHEFSLALVNHELSELFQIPWRKVHGANRDRLGTETPYSSFPRTVTSTTSGGHRNRTRGAPRPSIPSPRVTYITVFPS